MISPAELLSDLVAIPSVNPLLCTDQVDDERSVAAYVAGFLRASGAEVEMLPVEGGRCNVVGHLSRGRHGNDSVLLLTAHMDTYPAGGPRSGYQAFTEQGVLYGRGSADAKGSLAAMLAAFADAAKFDSRREAYLAATVDEECLLLGARQLSTLGIRPALGITGEPTSLVPITGQKGIIRGYFVIRRPRSHAAYPAVRTAVSDAMRLVNAVNELNREYERDSNSVKIGGPTITITKLESDGGMNLVADEVKLWFDARFLPGNSGENFIKELTDDLGRLAGPDMTFDLGAVTFISPANRLVSNVLSEEFFAVVSAVTGRCEPESFAYGSEAGVLADFCDASLVFGPGDAAYSHRDVEAIETAELDTASEVFRKMLIGG